MFAIGGNDVAAEGFVFVPRGVIGIAALEPLVVLNGVAEIGIRQSGSLFDEVEGVTLGRGYFVRVAVLGAMGHLRFAETFGEIQAMVIGRQFAGIGFVLFV